MLNNLYFKFFILYNFRKLNETILNYIKYDEDKFNEINNMFFNDLMILHHTTFKINLSFHKHKTQNMILLYFYFQGYVKTDHFQEYVFQFQNSSLKNICIYFDSQVYDFFKSTNISFKDIVYMNKKIKYLNNHIKIYIQNDKDIILDYFDLKK